ncbi:MAG: hypothetical protein U9P14_01370, partial [Gemmatimonadota bacterium]|nr:hypothetical protein [Gemmatimonadota bacterium]
MDRTCLAGKLATAVILLLALFSAGYAAGREGVLVKSPWITTDRSVNCFDAGTLVADLTAGLTEPRDQAIAIYRFFQRTMFPYSNRNEYPFPENDQSRHFDFLRVVNVYGYALCSQTSTMFASLCRQSGLFEDARAVGVPGHVTAHVKWNGKWHFMDPIVGCYVLGRQGRDIVSIGDIVADTTLLTRAVAEGRAGAPFLPWDGESIYPEGALAERDSWFTYRRYGMDFLLETLPDTSEFSTGEPITHTMAFNLRPGFRLRRIWDHRPGMYNLSYEYFRQPFNRDRWTPGCAILPPHHPDCGKCEERDSINLPLYKPYRKTINGRDTHKYYANGVLSFEDDFSSARRILAAADSVGGLEVAPPPDRAGGLLRCAEGVADGAALFTFEAPYVFVGGEVAGCAQVQPGSWAAIYMDLPNSDLRVCLGLVEKSGDFRFEVPRHFLGERYGFKLLLRLH